MASVQSDYIVFPIETDPDTLATDALEYLQTVIPGWQPSDGNLEVVLVAVMARMVAQARDVAADVPKSIFRYFGAKIAQVPPIDASAASGLSTWTMKDNLGYTIPANTVVGIPVAGDELAPFVVEQEVIVPPGSTATGAGAVLLVAVVPGSEASNLSGTPVLIDALDFVSSITLTGPTQGGQDAEEDDEYLNRLSEELKLLSPRPILADDFAVLAKKIPGVERATAIDNFIPPSSTDQEKAVTVIVVDAAGQALSAPVKTEVQDYLESLREWNFIVSVTDPSFNAVKVNYVGTASVGWDPADVKQRVDAAIMSYLDPATWGTLEGEGETPQWINKTHIRMYELATVINNVDGFDELSTLQIAFVGNSLGTADLTMTGIAPLPTIQSSDLTGSVS